MQHFQVQTSQTLTLGDMAKKVHRPVVYLHGVMARFELPQSGEGDYPSPYQAFLRTLLTGRIHGEVRQEAPLVKAALHWAKSC